LATLPLAVASRAVRRGLRAARGPHAGLADEVDAVVALTASETGSVSLAGGLQATREGPWVALHGEPPATPVPASLNVPGSLEFGPWTIMADKVEVSPVTLPGGRVAALDGDVVGSRLVVRTAGPGERVEINTGTKKVATVLSEAGIAPRLRPGWPIAVAHGMMAWIGGIRAAAWAARTPTTESFVTLWMED
jgi:tRNA(Ile)-lysidine synthetase-like protein